MFDTPCMIASHISRSETGPIDGPLAVVRTDPAPGYRSLENDPILRSHRILLDLGKAKNIKKKPVTETAVQEFEELVHKMESQGEPIINQTLALATSRMNRKMLSNGLSFPKIMTQRDQYTNEPMPISDKISF